jgi:Flp pilus assembly pilin Flp
MTARVRSRLLGSVRHRPRAREAGQTTAEYALVIIGAAVVAGLLAKWAAGGAISKLFDNVVSKILP